LKDLVADGSIPILEKVGGIMAEDRNSSIGWFVAGLGLGALIGVLYAPKSGRETREQLMSGFDEGREYLTNRGRDAGTQVRQWVDKGKETVGRQRDQISSAFEAGRQAYREATGGGGNPGGNEGRS
jgi:gas vesicle protein